MVNYLLQNDSVLRNKEIEVKGLFVPGMELLYISNLQEIPMSRISGSSVLLIDQPSLTKTEIMDATSFCDHSELKSLLLLDPSYLEDPQYLGRVDEFCMFPINPKELMLRMSKLVGSNQNDQETSVIRVDDLFVDLSKYDVYVGSRKITLTYKEFQLLVSLASNPGHVYSREDLLSKVWGFDYLGGTRTVDVHIRRLRSKIEDAEHVFVETIWNVGYRFNTSAN